MHAERLHHIRQPVEMVQVRVRQVHRRHPSRPQRPHRFGPHPVNTSGGLKAKGHPVGATGTGQVVEIWKQMRGEAGERQVTHQDVDLALTHNVGGTGQTCAVHIFERRN